MEAYAVVEANGHQYMVKSGDTFNIDRLDAEAGTTVELGRVLAVSDGSALNVGAPVVDGAAVKAQVIEHLRGKKVVAFKKKRRKGFERKVGHRQELTKIKIEDIG